MKDKCLSSKAAKCYRSARNRVNFAVTFAKIEYMSERFTESFKNRNVWDVVNRLTGRCRRSSNKVSSLIHDRGVEVTSDSGIFGSFADFFVVRSEGLPDPALIQTISDYCDSAVPDNRPNEFEITGREVSAAISKLKWRSSCSSDGIPAKFLKNLSCVFIAPIVILFNQILHLCVIPIAFRTSLVTPLYKCSGPKNHSNSYRPISVLNPITKVFEFILFARLRLIIEPLLCIQQHGFRQWFSDTPPCFALLRSYLKQLTSGMVELERFLSIYGKLSILLIIHFYSGS